MAMVLLIRIVVLENTKKLYPTNPVWPQTDLKHRANNKYDALVQSLITLVNKIQAY